MACDDWKREQDAARGRWIEIRQQECSEIEKKWHCDEIEKKWHCDEIEKKWHCDEIEKKWHCDIEEEKKTCDSWSIWTKWLCLGWSYVKTGVCLAGRYIETGVCLAGKWIETGVCLAGKWIETGVCKVWTWTVDKIWMAGVAVAWGACKVWDWATGWAREPNDLVDDSVPDLSGVNFDRKDGDGNIIPFLWGVSTASFQVEGGIENNDWHHFTHTQSIKDRVAKLANLGNTTLQIEPAGRAVDHWDLDVLKEDLDRAQLLGLNAYRFSIEWARIQPDKPAWADTVISKRKQARDALILASVERNRSGNNGDDNGRNRRAEELEALAAELEQEAQAAINTPYDPNEFKSEPVLHYVEMVKAMKARGLEPILTMMHMTLPEWVLMPPENYDIAGWGALPDDRYWNSLRGWETDATVAAFIKFVRFVTPYFKDNVKYFVTINEPIGTVTGSGYLAGIFPPGFLGAGNAARRVHHNFVNAHIAAYKVIKDIIPGDTKVGVSHWVGLARRAPQDIIGKIFVGDNEAAKNQWHYAVNQYFLDAIVLGHRNPDIWRKHTPSIDEESKDKVDFIAPQYYRACDVYHDKFLALVAPWWGGQFTVDLRGAENLAAYLFNDLGWTIYPGGLYRLLKFIYDRYSKPILITENGMCEMQDRNRAAYTISHLQQVLRAIKDDINVIGYVHWSIVDNFEWAFGYQNSAHFGLFSVDRETDPDSNELKSFPRHITEGALAYQYLIANSHRITATNSTDNPFDAPLTKFGTITGDGRRVQAPELLPGALWEGSFEETGSIFMLYLSRLPSERWLGMIFFQDTHQWLRLQDISWHADESGNGTLKFRYPAKGSPGVFVIYSAKTVNSKQPGIYTPMQGTVTVEEGSINWSANRVVQAAIWKNRGKIGPSHIATNRLEGDFEKWHARYMWSRPTWLPVLGLVAWTGSKLTFTGSENFEGKLANDILSGTVTAFTSVTGGGSEDFSSTSFAWEGARLPDDIPF